MDDFDDNMTSKLIEKLTLQIFWLKYLFILTILQKWEGTKTSILLNGM